MNKKRLQRLKRAVAPWSVTETAGDLRVAHPSSPWIAVTANADQAVDRVRCLVRIFEVARVVTGVWGPDALSDERWPATRKALGDLLKSGTPAKRAKSYAPDGFGDRRDYRKMSPTAISGEVCPTCFGPNYIRTGTCLTCQDCGTTSGCG